MKNSLSFGEWTVSLSIFLVIASFVFVAKVNAHRAFSAISEIPPPVQEISVDVQGAVKKPGSYRVSAGTTVEEVLRKARPLIDADLESLPLKKRIDSPMELHVEPVKEIRVAVGGAIQEAVELILPPQSRICDLRSKVIFTKETDKTFFRRKKRLRHGDKIEVPKKTIE